MKSRDAAIAMAVALVGLGAGCRPNDVLSVPAPTGVLPASAYASQSGAEQIEANGAAYLAQGFSQYFYGALEWSGLLADEFYWRDFTYAGGDAGVDARQSEGIHGFLEPADNSIKVLMSGHLTLSNAVGLLEQYEPTAGKAKIGLAFALLGYTELLAAEDFCAGLPLDHENAAGVVYGMPLTTDSLLGVAEAHFDSAAAYANGDATVVPLAAVGLARAQLDRGKFTTAANGLGVVPTSFVYSANLPSDHSYGLEGSNLYDWEVQLEGCGEFNVANNKGQNGLNYVAAADPRLVFNTTLIKTCDGQYALAADSVFYYPAKFGNPSTAVPLATGAEARLIEAEVALHAGQVATWAADLNALRAAAPATYLQLAGGVPPLTTDSTTAASATEQVDVMFRERAFWLFGMGMRLGDMRRLIRQYGRDQGTVFPTGPYPFGSLATLPSPMPSYGTDVSLTLPTAAGGLSDPNPNYKGCTASPKVA